ncbi:MAG TPA: RagB/SusD family nutrient uptake outer membrane protein [Longimicrobiales bacterium]
MKNTTLLLIGALAITACDLDLQNPNAPTAEEVASDTESLIAAAVGMQGDYALQFDEFVQASALVSDEWGTGTASLLSYRTLFDEPQNLEETFGVVEEPFAAAYEVVDDADFLIANVPQVIEEGGVRTGILALANLFRGMALGMVALQYEEAPVDISVEHPVPRPRVEVLDAAITSLEGARTLVGTLTDDQLEGLVAARVVPSSFDIPNTIDAMLARYYLVRAGITDNATDYAAAATAAARVDLSAVSQFRYTGVAENPIYNLSEELNYVRPLYSFLTDAEAGDDRPAFWVDETATPTAGVPDSLLLPLDQYDNAEDPIYAYLPDEMLLIQAEAAARQGDFATARDFINEVRTGGADPLANLPELTVAELDTEDEVLRQIAYERRYELYMQGLRWEDMRRLDAYIDSEPTIEFLPYPQQECVTNPNANC